QVGQLNGLSVISLGTLAFGQPSRITAQVRLGRGEVVDIEREVELGGPLHSKGVLILSGFLGGRFGGNRPLSLNASLVFEQSYGGVDGDRAAAEAGRVRVEPIDAVDRGLELLTGIPAGQPDAGGFYPAGTLNQRIAARLDAFAAKAAEFARLASGGGHP